MTDKQIIVDGVDVSECPQLMEDYQRANNIEGRYEHIKHVCECGERGVEEYWFECKYNPNCYYKQLKRKEQECEELNKLVKKQKDVLIHKTILADEYEKAYSFENLKVAKLKYCLAEIKEIAEHCITQDICTFCDYSDKCYIEDEEIPTYDVCKLILQKISECEGNNEYS